MTRATVMGLGRFGGGLGAARHLLARGHRVTVTDLAPREAFADLLAELTHERLREVFGRHDEADFTDVDLVVANPAVPWNHPLLERARAAGVRVATEVELFLEQARGPVLAVTGSNGKTTTAHLLHALLERAGRAPILGGNMGISLLDGVERLTPGRPVVFEISSFQLEALPSGRTFFAGGILTSLTPNHLDRHGTMAAYVAAKARLIAALAPDAPFVHDARCPIARELAATLRPDRRVPVDPDEAADFADVAVNRVVAANLAQAFALARAHDSGIDRETAREVARAFRGLPDRLEEVARRADGLVFVNDTKATTPEACAAAVDAFAGPVHLIAGGYDKKLDPAPLLRAAGRCASVRLVEATAPALHAALTARGVAAVVHADLAAAVADLAERERGPGVALFSPGHASFGVWRDYRQRGAAFRELALAAVRRPRDL